MQFFSRTVQIQRLENKQKKNGETRINIFFFKGAQNKSEQNKQTTKNKLIHSREIQHIPFPLAPDPFSPPPPSPTAPFPALSPPLTRANVQRRQDNVTRPRNITPEIPS